MSTLPEPAASRRFFRGFRDQIKSPARDAVIRRITQHDSTKLTTHYLAHRLKVGLNELGLFPHVPSDWLEPGPGSLAFRPLNVAEADKLVLAIEDLADGHEPPRQTVSSGQLSFDLGHELDD